MSNDALPVELGDEFERWILGIDDRIARAAILDRIDRLSGGLAGDVAAVGDGVSELRVHYGAGWRVYYVRRGGVYRMLIGGSIRNQPRDIKRAKALAKEL